MILLLHNHIGCYFIISIYILLGFLHLIFFVILAGIKIKLTNLAL